MRPALLAPEIVLFLGGLAALLGGSFLARTRQWVTRAVAAAALLVAAALAALDLPGGLRRSGLAAPPRRRWR